MPPTFKLNGSETFDVACHHQDFEQFCGPACLMMLINYHNSSPTAVTSQVAIYQDLEDAPGFGAYGMKAAPIPMRDVLNDAIPDLKDYKIITSGGALEAEVEAFAARIVNSILDEFGPVVVPVNDKNHWVLFYGAETDAEGKLVRIKMRNPTRIGAPPYEPTGPVYDHSPANDPCIKHMEVHEQDQDVNWRGLLDLLTPTQWEFDQYYSLALVPKNVPRVADANGEEFKSAKTKSRRRKE